MINWYTIVTFAFCVFIITIAVIFSLLVWAFICKPYFIEKEQRDDFETLFVVFQSIIKAEIDLYDRNIFENHQPITNANFENYYKDLSSRITSKISPWLMHGLERYMTEEAIVSYVSRTVQIYLIQFVQNPI